MPERWLIIMIIAVMLSIPLGLATAQLLLYLNKKPATFSPCVMDMLDTETIDKDCFAPRKGDQ